MSVLGLWEEKENISLSLNTLRSLLQLGEKKGSGGLRAATSQAPGHRDASVVHLALARLRGGVMLTGELSGAAQRSRLWGIRAHDAHVGLRQAVSYLRPPSTPPHPLAQRAARLRDSRDMQPCVIPLDGLVCVPPPSERCGYDLVHMAIWCWDAPSHPG